MTRFPPAFIVLKQTILLENETEVKLCRYKKLEEVVGTTSVKKSNKWKYSLKDRGENQVEKKQNSQQVVVLNPSKWGQTAIRLGKGSTMVINYWNWHFLRNHPLIS